MSGLLPISTYNLALQPFSPVPAVEDDYPVTIRLTLAAVDPEAVDDKEEPSTLRMLKRTPFIDDSDEEDYAEGDSEDDEEDDEEDDLDDEPEAKKSKKSKKDEEEDEEDEEEDDEDEDLDDEDEDEDLEDEGVEEFVICTLGPKVQYQQTIELTITPDEEVYFVVTGSYPIHLTGNYVEHPADDDDSEDEEYDSDEYDLSPDEDEVYGTEGDVYDLEDLEDESDVENKIEELVEEEAQEKNNKRSASDDQKPAKKAKKDKKSVQFSKELEQGPTGSTYKSEEEKKDTKKEKKEKKENKKEAKEANDTKEDAKESKGKKFPTNTLLGGVVTEDRKIGKGPTAKSGNKVGIRYIGKLKNGKVFDKNTSGKPFNFALGKGECIKGFDLGVAGMAVGGERRVIIPPKMGYGSQALPGIPANSELTFDIKLVNIK